MNAFDYEKTHALLALLEIAETALRSANVILPNQDECPNEAMLRLKNKVDDLRYEICTLNVALTTTNEYEGWKNEG